MGKFKSQVWIFIGLFFLTGGVVNADITRFQAIRDLKIDLSSQDQASQNTAELQIEAYMDSIRQQEASGANYTGGNSIADMRIKTRALRESTRVISGIASRVQSQGYDLTQPGTWQKDSSGEWEFVSNTTPGSQGSVTPGGTTDRPYMTIPSRYSSAKGDQDCGSEGLAGQRFLFFNGPLVPCGVNKHCASDTGGSINKPCTICHFFVLIQNFFNLLLSLLIVVSIFMLTVAGVLYIISAGGKMATTAKEIIHKTLLGFGLFLLSWLIVFTLLKLLDVNTSMLGTGSGWFQFTCDDESAFWIDPENQTPNPTNTDQTPNPTNTDQTPNPTNTDQTSNPEITDETSTNLNGVSSGDISPYSLENLSKEEIEARKNLILESGNNITIWESGPMNTNIRNLLPETRSGLLAFQKEAGIPLQVNAGADQKGHDSVGTYSHRGGHKVDIQNSPELLKYVKDNYQNVGKRDYDGATVWRNPNNRKNYFAEERNGSSDAKGHLDVCFNCPLPPMED